MADQLKLPARPFLYTMDQVATLLGCTVHYLRQTLGFFEGRTVTKRSVDEIQFVNIAPREADPEWRCSESELLRFLKRKGFRVVDASWK